MPETEPTNWQIRVSIFDTQENAYKITEAIEALNLGYDVRILNIDKGDDEVDDETHIFCKSCGRLDGALHNYVCDACLILEKEKRQQEEETKFPDSQYLTTWGDMAICTDCNQPAAYRRIKNGGYWHCPNPACPNIDTEHDQNCCGQKTFDAKKVTKEELEEIRKQFPHAEWI